ncbi:hypothetical protein AMATHDRAFT_465 [Amanita thiersii Skay4041]|uniref:Uncharacterized protein n=1 Tax=Amanita thiersii Skay4041 TaxID=703135 RepID=A0A2A9P124_9AGAR|nr:hypothetical protein AMATHDRAFT_465 [Amanita thiersii Skay4041]
MENDFTFVAPEGVYTVTEEHKTTNAQNQAVSAGPLLYPTKVSTLLVRYPPTRQSGAPAAFAQLLGGNKDPKKDKLDKSLKEKEDGVSLSSSDSPEDHASSTQENPISSSSPETHTLFAHPQGPSKKRSNARPRHNIKTSSSTFITRVQTAEGLTKILQAKQGDTSFLFYNVAKSYLWVEAGSKAKDPLSRITFSAYPTCHDVNVYTASPDHIDIIIGFATGDLIWLDPISSRYCRLNKQGCISNSPCTSVRWVPSSPTLFLVSHADGTIVAYDKEREDGVFTAQDPDSSVHGESSLEDSASHKEWDPTDNVVVTMPPWHPVMSVQAVQTPGKPDKDKTAKNPVSHWRVSRRSIIDFVFSPDVKYVGAISDDGCLRIIDAMAEQLVDCYASYFGALTCVAWSPDGRFVITGGQDDLLTIFSPWEQRVVARCQGHSSFVSAIAFDELRCDGRTYRFGSVGEDNKVILWDFSSGAVHHHYQRMSISSTVSLSARRDRSALHLPPTHLVGRHDNASPRYHPAPSRNEIAIVQPVLVKTVECDLLTDIGFLPRFLLTSTKTGHIRLWIRPLAPKLRMKNHRAQPIADTENKEQ